MVCNALTLVTRIKPAEVDALKAFLDAIGQDVAGNPHIAFSRLGTTHFLRWVVLDRDPGYGPQLAFESNFDGPLDSHLEELVQVAGPALEVIYGHCEDYLGIGGAKTSSMKSYLLSHAIPYAAFYQAYPGRTVNESADNSLAYHAISSALDARRSELSRLRPAEIHQAMAAYFRNIGPKLEPVPTASRPWQEGPAKVLVESRLVQIALVLLLLPILIPFVVLLLWHEWRDAANPKQRDQVDEALIAQEDYLVQNQLTHLVELKPGWFRRMTLKAVLASINFLARYYYNRGELGGIPTIHFARWAFIDDDRRLLFFSNYDGSWENYLGDFIDRASAGLTGVWSNTKGFPKSLLLVFKGARNEEAFKQWTRDHQIPTQVWYSAHANESVQNILNNAAIRAQLSGSLSDEAAKRWLMRF